MKGQLLETIRCEAGRLHNLEWHQARMERSCLELFGLRSQINFQRLKIPPEANNGLFKCSVLYDSTRIYKVKFIPYAIRPVKKLKLIRADGLQYQYKYADRSSIQALFEKRGEADDILMVINGLITDTSYANIALFDGARWYTPARPLLCGTRRAALLAAGQVATDDIAPGDLSEFKKIRLFNAMMGWEEGPCLAPKDII